MKKITVFIISLGLVLGFSTDVLADETWQKKLEREFDIVETFDNLRDWIGLKRNAYSYDPNDMPKKDLDGSPSNWDLYSYYSTKEPIDNWIGNHGTEYTWQATEGRSLGLSYPDPLDPDYENMKPYPDRMGMYLGNGDPDTGPKSGYKRIYIFFMLKFRPGYFAMKSETEFEYVGVLKFLQISSGFRAPDQWGTEEEQRQTCDKPQTREVYGLGHTLFQISNGREGNSLVHTETTTVPIYKNDCGNGESGYDYQKPIDVRRWYDADFGSQVLANGWIGMEFMLDIGTLGNEDGSTEIWIYDQNGNETGHQVITNYNKLQIFDHIYNKVVLGGNRIGRQYGPDPSDSMENRFYVDDFIVDNSRIGLKYFALRNGTQNTTPPNPPTGLRVE